ncbi:hypothetical protein [Pontibacter sp. SGAir0037]|uniref:hypothetical protein n=1 Tax=Pontibacter sp. SGAir0037 TaxID=2571030 RepID=UPI0010CD2038|nr:hypothetical protein [Pontibacter sp. SGAir0037]QCR24242.1 hypothetical protein C1N53_19030 [Pontibacter sp. SGAir0037]
MVFFDSNYLHVEYYAATNVLVTQWYGGCSSLQYRQALIKGLRISKELQVEYAIIDERMMPPLSSEDFQWLRHTYLKAFNKLPFKRFAVVNAFDNTALKQLKKVHQFTEIEAPFETRAFDDLTSAYDWLISAE